MTTVAVIGAGGAGAALVTALSETEGITRIDVFDPLGNTGGEAFLTPTSAHLCNTSAATMSLKCNDDDHFYRWLGPGVPTPPDETFVPRTVYRQYLTETVQNLGASAATPEIRLHRNRITDIRTGHDGARLRSEDATFGSYGAVVLAPGVQSPSNRHGREGARNTAGGTRHFTSQYAPEFQQFLEEHPGCEVGIIGTKLSGIDAAKSVLEAGSRATLVSRSGELPAVRRKLPLRSGSPLSEGDFAQRSASPDLLLRTLRDWFSDEQDRNALTSPGSVREPAAPRLRRETEQAISGEEWQERVGEFIDLANQVWKRCSKGHLQALLDACRVWIPRYVSSIPLENARFLERGFDAGSLSVSSLASWHSAGKHPVDTPGMDAVVWATGSKSWGWSVLGTSQVSLSEHCHRAPDVGADLRLRNHADAPVPRVWAVGDITRSRYPVVNYMRTSTLQAREVAAQIVKSTHGTGPYLHEPSRYDLVR